MRRGESARTSRRRRPPEGGTSRTSATHPCGPSHPATVVGSAHPRRHIWPFLRVANSNGTPSGTRGDSTQRRSTTIFPAAMKRTRMKISATGRVRSARRPHREPRYAPKNTVGKKSGMRMKSEGHANPPGRTARFTTYVAKPTAAVGMIRREDVPIAFRVRRPRPYTIRGTFRRPPPIPMLPERNPEPTVAAVTLVFRGGVIFESRSEEHTSELQSQSNLVCRLLLEKKKKGRRRYAATSRRSINQLSWLKQ